MRMKNKKITNQKKNVSADLKSGKNGRKKNKKRKSNQSLALQTV